MHSRQTALFALTISIAFMACSSKRDSAKKGPLVAKGDGVAVSAEEFKAKLDEQSPFIRARYATLDRKKEFLDNLVRFELLAHEAEEQKLDQDPEVRETLRKIMVQKLVRKAFDEKEAAKDVPESEVRKHYDQHLDEYVKPERVRVSQIFLKAEKGSPGRAAKAEQAKKLLAKLKVDEVKNPLTFSSLARDASEDQASKAGGGDLGFRTHEELEKQYSKELAAAAFALKDMGQESAVVESPQGFHILKLGARQSALNRSFEEVKAQLAANIGRENRTRDFDEFVKKLREKAGIKIDDAELDKVAVAAAPAPQLGQAAAAPAKALEQ